MIDPKLEVAGSVLFVARECSLRFLLLKLVENLAVCNITDLIVLSYQLALGVANATLSYAIIVWRHHGIACVIGLAYIAVDALPTIFALTGLVAASWCSVASVWQRAAERL